MVITVNIFNSSSQLLFMVPLEPNLSQPFVFASKNMQIQTVNRGPQDKLP